MDWGNLILFWALAGVVLFVLNFILFRFGFVRKLIYIVCSIILIVVGFEVNKLIKENTVMIGGSISWDNSNIDTLIVTSMVMLIMVLLMSVGDSLLDFEDAYEYDVDVMEFFGTYFFSVSEETVSVPSFLTYYAIATVVALIIYFVGIVWWKWFWTFGVVGCIALGYELIIKPILLKFSA